MRFRKKPVEIEAVQLRWDTWSEMCEHAGVDGKPEGCYLDMQGNASDVPVEPKGRPWETGEIGRMARIGMKIPTLEGLMVAREGDWVIRGVKGELYPCKPDIFEATYDQVHVPHCAFPHPFGECPRQQAPGGPAERASGPRGGPGGHS